MRKALHVVVFVIILGFLLSLVPQVRQVVKKGWEKIARFTQQNLRGLKSSVNDIISQSDLLYYWDFENQVTDVYTNLFTGTKADYSTPAQKKVGLSGNGWISAYHQSSGLTIPDGYSGRGVNLNNTFLVMEDPLPSGLQNMTIDLRVKIPSGKKIYFQWFGSRTWWASQGIDVWGEIGTAYVDIHKWTGADTSFKTAFGVTSDQWTRVSFVFQSAGNNQSKYSIFVDGKLAGAMTTDAFNSAQYVMIGRNSWGAQESVGVVDDVMIYGQALLQCGNGILEGADRGFTNGEQCDDGTNNGKGGSTCSLRCEKIATAYPAFESSLVHYFPFEEGNWNSTFDPVGGKRYTFSDNIGFSESGKKGRALSVNGGYATPNNAADDPINVTRNQWTMDFWLKLKNVGTPAYYSMKIFGQPDWSYDSEFFQITANTFLLRSSSFNRGWYEYNVPINLALDTWHRVTIVAKPTGNYGSAKYRLYMNGQGFPESEEVQIFQSDTGDPKKSLRFGKGGGTGSGSASFNAEIDEFKIYNTALTDADIAGFAWCGNGVIDPPKEECDEGANNGAAGSLCSAQCIDQTPSEDPMGYWKFDEGSGTVSKSASGYDLTLKNGATFGDSQTNLGKALKLDGVDDYAVLSSVRFKQSRAITIEAWIKANNPSLKQYIVSLGSDRDIARSPQSVCSGFGLSLYQNKLRFEANTDADDACDMTILGRDLLATDRWYYVVLTYKDDDNAYLYVDGELKEQLSATGSIFYRDAKGDSFTLGTLSFESEPVHRFPFAGSLDEVSFYNRVLSDAEIAARYNAMKQVIGDTPPPKDLMKDLIAYWKMDEIPGSSTITDFSGNNLIGKEDSAAPQTPQALTFVPGKLGFGSALQLNGQTTIRVTPTDKLLAPDKGKNLTISYWIKGKNPTGTIVEKKADRKADRSGFDLSNNNGYNASFTNGKTGWSAGKNQALIGNSATSDSQWHMITVTAAPNANNTGEVLKTYLDGKPDGDGVNALIGDSELVDLFIGNGINGPFTGLLDDLRIYKRALTDAEIAALYTALPAKEFCGNTVVNNKIEQCSPTVIGATNLLGHWKLDESAGASEAANAVVGGIMGHLGGTIILGPGKTGFGNAATFDSNQIGQLVLTDLLPTTLPNVVTVEFWMKWAGFPSNVASLVADDDLRWQMPISFSRGGTNASMYDLALWADGSTYRLGFNTGSGNLYGRTFTSADFLNQWVHVVAVFKAGDIRQSKLFVNGQEVAYTHSYLAGWDATTLKSGVFTQEARVSGRGIDTRYKFNGSIDNLRIFNTALTLDQAKALYQQSNQDLPAAPCTTLVNAEECDDGNSDNTDTCTNQCLKAVCGDGNVRTGVEECDLGAQNSDTGACTASCTNAICGDNKIQAGVEQCDDGNAVETDACIACKDAVCGDGKIRAGIEQCDDGPNNDVKKACAPQTCAKTFCGDGMIQELNGQGKKELCDDGPANADTGACDKNCQSTYCGDGIIQPDFEACDDGPNNGVNKACVPGVCTKTYCGDGTTQELNGEGKKEECDLGEDPSGKLLNGAPGATCTTECKNAPPPEFEKGGWNWGK